MTAADQTPATDSPKMLRETLCVAQMATLRLRSEDPRASEHIARLQQLIDDLDKQRPLGPDGKHGNRHTPTCGCEDTPATDSERVERIWMRLEVASPGPWTVETDYLDTVTGEGGDVFVGTPEGCITPLTSDEYVHADAEFIAHAPEDVRYLLALLAEQAATIERQEQSLADERDRVIQAIRDQGEWEPDQVDEYGRVELAGYVTIGTRELTALGSQRTEGHRG